jgi:hypothetical protein
VLVAYIPIVYFSDSKAIETTLINRFFHQCMKVIFQPLVSAGNQGLKMSNSLGDIRHCYLRLAAYAADYPEQCLINIASVKNSPVTTAGFHQLDDPTPSPPRTRTWILERIREASSKADPNNIPAYQKAAKALGLNGVDQPFWEVLPGYQPELCLAPDILHGLLRFWRDHLLCWTRLLVGPNELDKRIKVLQEIVGFKTFRKGIRQMSQWTGNEDRELAPVILPLIAGAPRIKPRVMSCLHAFHEFLYLAQYESHTPSTLRYLSDALTKFHRLKRVFIEEKVRKGKNGVIQHFRIPKLAALHSYATHIVEMGSSPQYSTDIVERCHRSLAKLPYRATNHKDFVPQMCRYLDRHERIHYNEEIIAWATIEIPRQMLLLQLAGHSLQDRKHALQELEVERQKREQASRKEMGRRNRINFDRGLWLAKMPTSTYQNIASLEDAYRINNLKELLTIYQEGDKVQA